MSKSQKIKVAVDSVIFGYEDQKLFVLLIQRKYGENKGQWALPGGFVLNNESLTDAVHRELKEETGISTSYLEQLYTFGDDVKRDPRAHVISVSYFGLVRQSKMKLKASGDAMDSKWFQHSDLPELAFDHAKIIQVALNRLQTKVQYQPIGFNLLRREFLFSDLENLYSTILNQKIDRRNFRKKIISLGLVEATTRKEKSGPGRPALLYKFITKRYKELEKTKQHLNLI